MKYAAGISIIPHPHNRGPGVMPVIRALKIPILLSTPLPDKGTFEREIT